jgi:hypothetical protein
MSQSITREGRYHAEHMAMMYADLARAAGCKNIKWWLSDTADDDGNITIQLTWTPPNIIVYSLDEMAKDNSRRRKPWPKVVWPKVAVD